MNYFFGGNDIIEMAPPPPVPVGPPQVVVVTEEVDDGIAVFLTRVFIVIGGVFPFIPQYLQIERDQDASGFSTHVCLVVVSSSILRIAYWFGHWFDNALLYQAILMTMVMMFMLEVCLRVQRVRAEKEDEKFEESYFTDYDLDKFWEWTTLTSYIQASMCLLMVASFYTGMCRGIDILVEPVGFLALMIESTLPVPQIMKNCKNGSTEGMNIWMVIMWTIGDAVKGYFFFSTLQPVPFRLCAIFQLIFDFILLGQVGYYRKSVSETSAQTSSSSDK